MVRTASDAVGGVFSRPVGVRQKSVYRPEPQLPQIGADEVPYPPPLVEHGGASSLPFGPGRTCQPSVAALESGELPSRPPFPVSGAGPASAGRPSRFLLG